MKTFTIVWDFDGTILPLEPFDSEQSLLIQRMNLAHKPFGRVKKAYARAIIYADRREWFPNMFKRSYIRLLEGTPSSVLDDVSRRLAVGIPETDRRTLRSLKQDGHTLHLLSCGTADLSERILTFARIRDCFSIIEGNRFQFADNRIKGMDLRLPNPDDKLGMMSRLSLSPDDTIVVGDGYTDLPLLNWSAFPVLIDRSGKKRKRFSNHKFYFITAIPKLNNIIEGLQNSSPAGR